jgi:hypothetical protein
MRPSKRKELSRRAKRDEERFWQSMKSAEAGKICYS